MKTFSTLSRQARNAAKFRGHDMKPFRTISRWQNRIWFSTCRKCGMEMQVNIKPMPNEIDVGGTAVALTCK